MPFDLGVSPGDMAIFAGTQPTHPVTNLSPHVSGGNSNNNAQASGDSKTTMYWSAGIVVTALVILWLSGALVFRGAIL